MITTTNTGPNNLYPGQRVYAVPYPIMVECGNGRWLPRVLPPDQPQDKFLLTTISLTDDVVFTMIRAAKRQIETTIQEVESFDDNINTNVDRIPIFVAAMNAWTAKKGEFEMADESLLNDFVLMYSIKVILTRFLTMVPEWRADPRLQPDDIFAQDTEILANMVLLGFRALFIFVRDREKVIKDFYNSIKVHNAKTVKAQVDELKEDDFILTPQMTSQQQHDVVRDLISYLDQMMDIAREEIVSFLERMYVGRVMNFSKPGGSLDVLMGAR